MREHLVRAGVAVIVVDVGILGEPSFAPDVPAAEVARAAGVELADLRFTREGSDTRTVALKAMRRGAIAVVRDLRAGGRADGVMGLGGSGGSTVRLGRPCARCRSGSRRSSSRRWRRQRAGLRGDERREPSTR